MFEKWGKKFAEGVKKEAANPETMDKVLDILVKVGAVVGILLLCGRSDRKKSNTQTVIVNNYIYDSHVRRSANE